MPKSYRTEDKVVETDYSFIVKKPSNEWRNTRDTYLVYSKTNAKKLLELSSIEYEDFFRLIRNFVQKQYKDESCYHFLYDSSEHELFVTILPNWATRDV